MPYQQTDKRIVMTARGLWIEVDVRILIRTLTVVRNCRDSTAVHENLWITGGPKWGASDLADSPPRTSSMVE